MGRFNNPSKVFSSPAWNRAPGASPVTAVGANPTQVASSPGAASVQPADGSDGLSSILATVGFWLFCAYLLSGYANDWAMKLAGDKAYLSTVTVLLLPFAWLSCGRPLRGLRSPLGIWLAVFLGWLILAAPLSVWKGGSTRLLLNYIPRCYLCFFYTVSFVTSLRRCRNLMYVNIAGAVILILTCITFGDASSDVSEPDLDDTRFRIPKSLFFANSNDLALALLLGITAFLFLFYRPGLWKQILGIAGVFASALYALKTGSRGCLVAAVATLVLILVISRSRLKVLALALVIVGVALPTLPSTTLHRLFLVTTDSSSTHFHTPADTSSIESQFQRQELFKKSLYYTWTHPLFGVGPDQFAVAVNGDAAKAGKQVPWLGTHNTYTQVSSECGIPALIFYCIVIVLCFTGNYRLYKQSRDRAPLKEIAGLSLCLLTGVLVYAVSTFFFHIAYSSTLPMLAGFTVALNFAARARFPREFGDARI